MASLFFIALPKAVVFFTILAFIMLQAWLAGLKMDAQALLQMRRHKRILRRVELIEKIQGNQGTLIVESTTVSWGLSRAWWTEDNILALCPVTPPPELENDEEASQPGRKSYTI